MAEEILQEAGKETRRSYKLSLWWVEHRAGLKRLLLGFFFAVNGIFIAFALWTMIDTFLISRNTETGAIVFTAIGNQAELHNYTLANRAQDTSIGRVSVIPAGEGKFDFHATLSNPNDDWYATFNYVFTSSAGETDPQPGFILPSEAEKPLVAFGFEAATLPRSGALELRDFTWRRVDRHFTGEIATFMEDRLDLRVSDITFDRDLQIDSQFIGRVSFTVHNASAFSYFDPTFIILLKRGANVVGVNRTTLGDIEAGETMPIDVNWFGTIPSATSVEVIPELNVLDPDAYKDLSAEAGFDARTLPSGRR